VRDDGNCRPYGGAGINESHVFNGGWRRYWHCLRHIQRAERHALVYFTLSPMMVVSPITMPVQWSIKKGFPIRRRDECQYPFCCGHIGEEARKGADALRLQLVGDAVNGRGVKNGVGTSTSSMDGPRSNFIRILRLPASGDR